MKIELKNGKYTIDGIEYDTFQAIPLEIKEKYNLEDKDGNGISDNFDAFQEMTKNFPKDGLTTTQTRVIINGKEFNSWDEVSPELRAQNDLLQKMLNTVMPHAKKTFSRSDVFSTNTKNIQEISSSPSLENKSSSLESEIPSKPLPVNTPDSYYSSNSSSQGNSLRIVAILIFLVVFLYLLFGDQIKAAIFD